ncbi:class I SAM-dependent methyltransferase [Flavobacterium sp.]|uniref:class I SAM-dependent methyltransferase n=1 Tax=Flavobacterium sp. TaxID=239 RepID=UPI002B4B4AED|nr:class I SAM-dependent methyltransferase [Flavobacterium sp.]HLP65076.1 class I SAM-dependent methyltransferase [Flavobacterium sp.]
MSFKKTIKSVINKLPYVKTLYQENLHTKKNSAVPAGHYYSPIVLIDDIKKREAQIWKNRDIDFVNGIELNTQKQIQLLTEFQKYYNEIPFKEERGEGLRYQFKNGFYSYTDGIVLYSMMRHYKPKRMIEIGSGYSSAVMLDTNELFFNKQIDLTFIDPYPDRLLSLMTEDDKKNTTVIISDAQVIELDIFKKLEAGDILFIDSSHVAKTGSDVNYILFEILSILKSGVIIHFHDIFFPFEYPKDWVYKRFNWNEDYFLRAFLMYNNAFEIKLFSDYIHLHHKEAFQNMPLCYHNTGGNLWIEKK